MLVEYLLVWCSVRVSLSPGCQKMAQLHELESKWETNYLRYILVVALFKIPLNHFSVLWELGDLQKCLSPDYVQQDKTLTNFISGERGWSAGSRAPHGSGSLTELRNSSEHDCAAWADGRAWESNHHYTPETRGWLLPPREEVHWPSIQPGAWIHCR